MNDDHVAEELLQRYFDGDLLPASARQVADHLASCERCRAAHGQLTKLQRLIGLAAEESARDVNFDALFGRVERGIREQGEPGLGERLSVWWGDLFEQRRNQVLVPMAGALAAAAVLALALRTQPQKDTDTRRAEAPSSEGAPAQADDLALRPAPAPEMAVMNSEIEQVDFGDNTGTVFEVALADGVSTPVVWINDEQ